MGRREDSREVERVWREFWAPIVLRGGKVNLAQVKRELFDFRQVIESVPKVYLAVTGGRVSKPLTDPEVVIALANEATQQAIEEELADRAEQEQVAAECRRRRRS